MNDNERTHERFASWLREQGHEPGIDVHDERFATVWFRTRGRCYSLQVDEADPSFLYVRIEYTLEEWITDEYAALRLAAATQAVIKAVKVRVDVERRSSWYEVEQFLTEPGRLDARLWRAVDAMENAAAKFLELARAERPEPAQAFIENLERQLGNAHQEGTR